MKLLSFLCFLIAGTVLVIHHHPWFGFFCLWGAIVVAVPRKL